MENERKRSGGGRFLLGMLTGIVLTVLVAVVVVTLFVGVAFYFVTPGMVVDATGVERAQVEEYVSAEFLDETRLSGLSAERVVRALDSEQICEDYAGVGRQEDPEGIEECADRVEEMIRSLGGG